jgi:hypothetical protein
MTIASTRMYRSLDNFLSSDTCDNNLFLFILRSQLEKCHSSVQVSTSTVPISFNEIRVDVHTTHSHSLTSQAIQRSLYSNMEGQPQDKPHEIV